MPLRYIFYTGIKKIIATPIFCDVKTSYVKTTRSFCCNSYSGLALIRYFHVFQKGLGFTKKMGNAASKPSVWAYLTRPTNGTVVNNEPESGELITAVMEATSTSAPPSSTSPGVTDRSYVETYTVSDV